MQARGAAIRTHQGYSKPDIAWGLRAGISQRGMRQATDSRRPCLSKHKPQCGGQRTARCWGETPQSSLRSRVQLGLSPPHAHAPGVTCCGGSCTGAGSLAVCSAGARRLHFPHRRQNLAVPTGSSLGQELGLTMCPCIAQPSGPLCSWSGGVRASPSPTGPPALGQGVSVQCLA